MSLSAPQARLSSLPDGKPVTGFQANLDVILDELTQIFSESAGDYDRSGAFPAENFRRLHEHGLLALTIPQAVGGGGGGLDEARKVISAVAKGEPSTALILAMQYLHQYRLQRNTRWPEHLRRRLADEAVRDGALINAFRVEPELGTPARGGLPGTLARRTAEGWLINGSKIYSTGSFGVTWYLVWARSDDPDPLVGAWLVHKDTPGIRIIEDWDHLGMRATCSHEVEFSDVRVPLEHAVSVSPWSAPTPEFDAEGALWMAVLLSSLYDGVAQAARDWLVAWLQERKPSNLGATLASLPRFQETVGRIDTLLFANRNLLESAAAGHVSAAHAGQIKQLATSNAIRAVELAVEAVGNPGLSRKYPLERHYRDVLCARVHTPQDDVVFGSVGRSAFGAAAGSAT
ncbi:acyl-CoA dehydrogenase family protein [Azomonas macrocytogenes]|uniref:Alkylation response protein AidB-like acyl-CoA dehydrogenase n=1 Tax=Azomonas macrocytogenes TaxID=69962 RepID=A0A839T154_AZOMA|nr:acyl-CoA dehydrogenase family protein [Azomonas macrocytogenes]MBB3102709.1 alkylation response protein AidB-like acyl-CoA dehydrogenase [Azomonas macrocytogenes]